MSIRQMIIKYGGWFILFLFFGIIVYLLTFSFLEEFNPFENKIMRYANMVFSAIIGIKVIHFLMKKPN